jgi:hypothetical protein
MNSGRTWFVAVWQLSKDRPGSGCVMFASWHSRPSGLCRTAITAGSLLAAVQSSLDANAASANCRSWLSVEPEVNIAG